MYQPEKLKARRKEFFWLVHILPPSLMLSLQVDFIFKNSTILVYFYYIKKADDCLLEMLSFGKRLVMTML